MNKLKKVIIILLLISLVYVPVAEAILWLLAGVIRAGAVAISVAVRTPLGQTILRSAVNHAIVGGIAYWYLQRTGVPPAETYIKVTLNETQNSVNAMKNDGKILPNDTYGTSLGSAGSGCTGHTRTCLGGEYCCGKVAGTTNMIRWSGATYSYKQESCPSLIDVWAYRGVCDAGFIAAYPTSDENINNTVDEIMNDPDMLSEVVDSIGQDISSPASTTGTPLAGEPITQIEGNSDLKEWPDGFSEADVRAWIENSIASGSSGGSSYNTYNISIDSGTISEGVGNALDERLGDVPNSGYESSSYDGSVESPEENSIADLVNGYISSSSVTQIIKGSKIEVENSECELQVSVYGGIVSFDYCKWQGFLNVIGALLIGFSTLVSVVIIFKR